MLAPSANAPATPLMLALYTLSVALVLLFSTPVGDTAVRQMLPLQQFQRPRSPSIMTEALGGVPDAAASSEPGNYGVGKGRRTAPGGGRHKKMMEEENAAAIAEAKRFVWRQRVRAMRHADYMRIETLHFLKLLSMSIPRLRLVWRGEDYCAWEGVTCTALRYPLETLIDVPHVLAKQRKRGSGATADGTLTRGTDGARLLGNVEDDPVVTLVGVRLRGMNLFGVLQGLRPVGASSIASPLLSPAAATAMMNTEYRRARRERDRRRLAITSPREPQYWPWEAEDMRLYAGMQNSTCEMVRYTLRRILRRLELRGERTNHPDLQGFAPTAEELAPAREAAGGSSSPPHQTASPTTAASAPSASSPARSQLVVAGASDVARMLHDTLLPQLTRQDIAQTVFGEIEPRLVGIQRFDISHNPGIVVAETLHWSFPYMRTFDTFGTTPQARGSSRVRH
ncbi:uncharacterized protein Tco025E_01760 [Trypanosoma conorhini]|uniref:Uncharacterized protein n=1 Tax=Trypanosoma conorhini TaxID=83891 RepID=A0A3R7PIZ7_9TRYP|nr:uncharacterized protein Tco025E_01760 [Trypanosoma conorhini]RNF26011.1 hypothetical protein Tco025E_01760 [Trypanosoma conorhini]